LTGRLLYRKSGYRARGARVVEENPFPRTGAQPLHVRDDHDIIGVRTVHSTARVRLQKDHDGPRKTDNVHYVAIVVMIKIIYKL